MKAGSDRAVEHTERCPHRALCPLAVRSRGPINVASFDVAFLKAAREWPQLHYRSIELGSLLADRSGSCPMGSTEASEYWLTKKVSHDALEDAQDAVRLYRMWKTGAID